MDEKAIRAAPVPDARARSAGRDSTLDLGQRVDNVLIGSAYPAPPTAETFLKRS
jgi:hypothetical protein